MEVPMRSCSIGLLAVLVVSLLAPAAHAERSFQIIPQVGMTMANLASEPEELENSAKVGYMIGGSLRFGARPFIQPGIYYQRTTINATGFDDLTSQTFEDDLGVSSVWIPVQVGINIINGDALDLHVNGGPTATIVTSVADNDFGLEKDDYESVTWGAVVGAGVDFTLISIDASYEFGLSKVLKDDPDDTKYNVFRLAAGLRF
jgi:hypothetical protein